MKELKFVVQASNREPLFQVTITKEERNLTARCTCPEGGVGHVCRHCLAILSGNRRMVVSDNADDLQLVESWVVWSDVGALIAHLADARRRLQKVKADAERSADAFDAAYEKVRTVERLLVQSIND